MLRQREPRRAMPRSGDDAAEPPLKARAESFSFYYGDVPGAEGHQHAACARSRSTALIGPSGCGKSTFLRCFNRMHDLYAGNRYEGEIIAVSGQRRISSASERRPDRGAHAHRHGVPEAEPVPQVDLRERRLRPARARRANASASSTTEVEEALRGAALWDEVKDRLHELGAATCPAASSSGCASPARWRPTRRSCCSTSRRRRSTRSPPRASRS